MANLNFQQPPRIPSASLTTRNTNSGFSSSSISGNVTPTSSLMFQTQQQGPNNFVSQSGQQQLSPNRLGAASIVGNTGGPPMNRRIYQNPSSIQRGSSFGSTMSMGSFMQSQAARYGSQSGNSGINNFQSVFGSSSDTPPTLLDMSEFPSLTNARGQNDQHSNVLQAPGSKPYVGMVKQPTSEQTEFQMSSEDFPALPGTTSSDNVGVVGSNASNQQSVSSVIGSTGSGHHQMGMSMLDSNSMGGDNKNSIGSNLCMDMMQSETVTGGQQMGSGHMSNNVSEKAKRGVQTSPNGLVTNIPPSMVNNQFGMIGLLTFIRAAESDPNLVSLAMGQDLTALGLNLNSMENLYQSFGGPFSDSPARPQDIDFPVPSEYLINVAIRDKLAQMKMKQYKDDLLFFLFYTNCGDVMQLAAANELYNRDWRYHIEEKIWIMRVPGHTNYDKSGTIERGTYYYFDATNWRRVPKEFQIDTKKLETNPPLAMS
ncbi:regulator of gene activity isoform X2 [Chironomus tepperi]